MYHMGHCVFISCLKVFSTDQSSIESLTPVGITKEINRNQLQGINANNSLITIDSSIIKDN